MNQFFPCLFIGCLILGENVRAQAPAGKDFAIVSAEEKVLRAQGDEFISHISDAAMAGLSQDDPLLKELYARRLASGYAIEKKEFDGSWRDYVDRDLQRRNEAMQVLAGILNEPKYISNRAAILIWVGNHPELPWALAMLEEAIHQYRLDPKAWDYADVKMLAQAVSNIGFRRHAGIFDEIDTSGVGSGSRRASFENRMKLAREGKKGGERTPQGTKIISMTPAEIAKFKEEEKLYEASLQKGKRSATEAAADTAPDNATVQAAEPDTDLTVVGILVAGAVLGLGWLVVKKRSPVK